MFLRSFYHRLKRMIKKGDVEKLAKLSRIKLTDTEVEKFESEFQSILSYVDQIKEIAGDKEEKQVGDTRNVFREDENPHESGEYSKDLINEFPESEDGFLKVKNIL